MSLRELVSFAFSPSKKKKKKIRFIWGSCHCPRLAAWLMIALLMATKRGGPRHHFLLPKSITTSSIHAPTLSSRDCQQHPPLSPPQSSRMAPLSLLQSLCRFLAILLAFLYLSPPSPLFLLLFFSGQWAMGRERRVGRFLMSRRENLVLLNEDKLSLVAYFNSFYVHRGGDKWLDISMYFFKSFARIMSMLLTSSHHQAVIGLYYKIPYF